MKKFPVRMCCVCRKHIPKNELIRCVKSENIIIISDKADGRGAYICNAEFCIENAEKRSALQRAFKMQINNNIYKTLSTLKREQI